MSTSLLERFSDDTAELGIGAATGRHTGPGAELLNNDPALRLGRVTITAEANPDGMITLSTPTPAEAKQLRRGWRAGNFPNIVVGEQVHNRTEDNQPVSVSLRAEPQGQQRGPRHLRLEDTAAFDTSPQSPEQREHPAKYGIRMEFRDPSGSIFKAPDQPRHEARNTEATTQIPAAQTHQEPAEDSLGKPSAANSHERVNPYTYQPSMLKRLGGAVVSGILNVVVNPFLRK